MASKRPPGTYSPSARTGRRDGGSGGVTGTVRRAGSDALPTVPVDSWATSIRRWSRPDTAFRFRGCFDMGNPLQHNPGLADPDGPGAPTDPGVQHSVSDRADGVRVRTTTPRIGTRAPNLHTISRIFSLLPANQSRTVFVAIADNPRRSRSPASRSGGAPRDASAIPTPIASRALADSGSSNGLHAARLKVQPAAPGNTGVAGRADERRVPASWSPGLPKRPARKRKGSARTGAICWRSLGWLRRPGADGASATALQRSTLPAGGGRRDGPRAGATGRRLRRPGADGASATALQPPPHLLTTLPAPAGGGRRDGPRAGATAAALEVPAPDDGRVDGRCRPNPGTSRLGGRRRALAGVSLIPPP